MILQAASGSDFVTEQNSLDPYGIGDHWRNDQVIENKLLALKTLYTILTEFSESEEGKSVTMNHL